nr:serine/threonine-protein kinase [Streptomyces fradiae]
MIDGRFELLERLGSGGMGAVWRARDRALQREVALKEVRPPDPEAAGAGPGAGHVLQERVWREARALARLSHPHVVTIHHIVDDEGPYPWLVMELLSGGTLQDRLDTRGPMTPAEAARTGRELLSALSAAHAAGIHHRDVKPANVLLRPDGGAVLTDFGIAALQGSVTLTAVGDVIGSPEYIAPERLRGRDDLPASDLWSLGMLLYVAVEGVNPVRRATAVATLAAVLDEPVPPPRRAGPLAPVLAELLVRDPAARPDAARLDRLLAAAAEGSTAPPPPAPTLPGPLHTAPTVTTAGSGPPAPAGRDRRGRRTVAGMAAAAVVGAGLAATGVYLALTGDGGNPPSPDADHERVHGHRLRHRARDALVLRVTVDHTDEQQRRAVHVPGDTAADAAGELAVRDGPAARHLDRPALLRGGGRRKARPQTAAGGAAREDPGGSPAAQQRLRLAAARLLGDLRPRTVRRRRGGPRLLRGTRPGHRERVRGPLPQP